MNDEFQDCCTFCAFFGANVCDAWDLGEEIEDAELTDEEVAALALSLPGNGDKGSGGKLQARWPKGSPNGLGGQFMEMPDVLKEVDRAGSADLTPFAIAAGAQHVTQFMVAKTQNPDQLLAKFRVEAPHTPGLPADVIRAANVGAYISRKALGVELIEHIVHQLDLGENINRITRSGFRKFTRKSFYNPYKIVSRLIKGQVRGPLPGLSEDNKVEIAELFCSTTPGTEEDGLIWKPSLPVGALAVSPGYDGKPMHRPLRVVAGKSLDPTQAIGLQDLVEAFEDGAVQHVTVPTSHADRPHENTGFVRKVRVGECVIEREGKQETVPCLECGIDFTEPDIKDKAKRGSIANVSVGVGFDYLRKSDGKKYRAVLQHLALTNKPWVNGMPAFGLSEDEAEIIPMFSEVDVAASAEVEEPVTWRGGLWLLRDKITEAVEAAGEQYEVLDFDADKVLVYDQEQGRTSAVPYLITEGIVSLSVASALPVEVDVPGLVPSDSAGEAEGEEEQQHAIEADGGEPAGAPKIETPGAQLKRAQDEREAALQINHNAPEGGDKQMSDDNKILGLSEDDVKALIADNQRLLKKERETGVETRVEELKALGFSEAPGFLKQVRRLLLSENGRPAVLLSEDGTEMGMTVTEIVNTLVDSLAPNGKFSLSEQHVVVPGDTAPDPGDVELSEADKDKAQAAAAADFLNRAKTRA